MSDAPRSPLFRGQPATAHADHKVWLADDRVWVPEPGGEAADPAAGPLEHVAAAGVDLLAWAPAGTHDPIEAAAGILTGLSRIDEPLELIWVAEACVRPGATAAETRFTLGVLGRGATFLQARTATDDALWRLRRLLQKRAGGLSPSPLNDFRELRERFWVLDAGLPVTEIRPAPVRLTLKVASDPERADPGEAWKADREQEVTRTHRSGWAPGPDALAEMLDTLTLEAQQRSAGRDTPTRFAVVGRIRSVAASDADLHAHLDLALSEAEQMIMEDRANPRPETMQTQIQVHHSRINELAVGLRTGGLVGRVCVVHEGGPLSPDFASEFSAVVGGGAGSDDPAAAPGRSPRVSLAERLRQQQLGTLCLVPGSGDRLTAPLLPAAMDELFPTAEAAALLPLPAADAA